jgi:hypothetical protein
MVALILNSGWSRWAEKPLPLCRLVPTVQLRCRNLIKDLIKVLLYLALSLGLVQGSISRIVSMILGRLLLRILVVIIESCYVYVQILNSYRRLHISLIPPNLLRLIKPLRTISAMCMDGLGIRGVS